MHTALVIVSAESPNFTRLVSAEFQGTGNMSVATFYTVSQKTSLTFSAVT